MAARHSVAGVAAMADPKRAAGGLLWRDREGMVEVALVHRPKYQDWSLPKGKPEPGEHPLATAYREVAEETGVRPEIGVRLPSTRYQRPTPDGVVDKTVNYWAMRAREVSDFTPNAEVDELRWVPLDEVATALSHVRDTGVVAAFAALPRPLRTVVLLRHAPAVAEWDAPDVTRPLDDAGAGLAVRLADLLALFAPVRVVCATPRRCVQTVAPLASRCGVRIESDSGFDAASHARSPEVTAERVMEVATTQGTVVVCADTGVVPDTVALLADTDGLHVPSVRTPAGAGWVLSFNGAALVAADFFHPIPERHIDADRGDPRRQVNVCP